MGVGSPFACGSCSFQLVGVNVVCVCLCVCDRVHVCLRVVQRRADENSTGVNVFNATFWLFESPGHVWGPEPYPS